MLKTRLFTFITTFTVCIAWNLVGVAVSAWLHLNLAKIGVPSAIIQLILLAFPLVLLLEVVVKLLLLRAFPPLKLIAIQAESWQPYNQTELARYTAELEQIGFVQLTDYTIPASEHKAIARLFAHPQRFCFAEVAQVGTLPMFCTISCNLEKHWSLAVTNIAALSAISFAFFRQPRCLVKRFEQAAPTLLLQSMAHWQESISYELDAELVQDMRAETYFKQQRSRRTNQRRAFLRKSVTWALLEMLWFSINPKSDWLGDYAKFKVQR
jgi:hypothetical protein